MEEVARGSALRARPVRLRGIRLGRVTDVVVDTAELRAVGLDVRCGDGTDRFLPVAAARIRPDEVEVRSALVLLDETDTGFYRRRARPLAELAGRAVERHGRELGLLADVELGAGGALTLVLDDGSRVAAGPEVALGSAARAGSVPPAAALLRSPA